VSKEVNIIAVQILEWINQNKIAEVGLKSLTIRESKSTGKCMALLLFRHREKIPSDFEKLKTIKNLSGIMVAYSNPKSPASNIDEIFFKYGKLELSENIGNINLSYPIDGFFQNNLHIFPKVLARMNDLLYSHIIEEKTKLKHPEISNSHLLNKLSENIKLKILELYCGIGTIGLCLSNKNTEIIGVDNISSNILYCQKNIKKNNIKSYQPILSASEKIDEIYFENVDLVILDPARVGLHHKVIKNLLKHKPNWIFYLSCNPVTQAHDVLLLSEEYSIKFLGGYDFYPHTPHLECLILLKRKR
jgi:23S rRNA (uracil1939-C5)-methyltransferase